MDLDTFDQLKRKYGQVGSWAMWSDCRKSRSDTSDVSFFDLPSKQFLATLHSDFVFVALNVSKPISKDRPFGNFHGGRNDYWLRDAISGTALEGSYMTDIIKLHPDSKSSSVIRHFRNNKKELRIHFDSFLEEMSDVRLGRDSLLIALGNDAFSLLSNIPLDNPIAKLRHYAFRHKKGEDKASSYREEVLDLLSKR